jgi:hypothetical protein
VFRADLRVTNELVYYRRYASERGSNTLYSGLFSAGLTRVSPYFGIDYTSTRERPGFEVDERARHSITKARTGAEFRLGPMTQVGLELARTARTFTNESSFRGVVLSDELDRTESVARLSIRHALTPLTRATFAVDVQSDRFNETGTRDSDSYRVTAGVQFEPLALIAGGATFGYRRLRFLGGSLEGNAGFISAVNLTYTVFTSTRLTVLAARDAQYSYDPGHPYYVQTGGSALITQRIFGAWDVQLSGGRQTLAYRDSMGRRSETAETDRLVQHGFGVGYTFGKATRLGISISRSRRRSPDPVRRFEGNQIGTSVTYAPRSHTFC